MKKMFHLCSHFYPATSIGGPIYCGLELLINLDKIASQHIMSYSTSIDQAQWSICHNQKFSFAKNSTITFVIHNLYSYLTLSRALFAAMSNNCCIFIHGTFNLQYMFALFVLKLFNYKCFIIPHGTLDCNRRINSRSFLVRYFSRIYIQHILYSNYLIFTNEAEYKAVNIVQKNHRLLYFISNFVPFTDESLWIKLLYPLIQSKNSIDSRTTLEFNSSVELEDQISTFLKPFTVNTHQTTLNLFFFGRLSPEKGVHIIIPTLSRLYKEGYINGLVVLGGTDDSLYESYIRNQFAMFNVPVFVSGFIPRPTAHKLLQLFRPALVFPSISDNFNLCLHECLNFGLTSFASTRINSVAGSNNPLIRPFKLEHVFSEFYESVIGFCSAGMDQQLESYLPETEPGIIINSYRLLLESHGKSI